MPARRWLARRSMAWGPMSSSRCSSTRSWSCAARRRPGSTATCAFVLSRPVRRKPLTSLLHESGSFLGALTGFTVKRAPPVGVPARPEAGPRELAVRGCLGAGSAARDRGGCVSSGADGATRCRRRNGRGCGRAVPGADGRRRGMPPRRARQACRRPRSRRRHITPRGKPAERGHRSVASPGPWARSSRRLCFRLRLVKTLADAGGVPPRLVLVTCGARQSCREIAWMAWRSAVGAWARSLLANTRSCAACALISIPRIHRSKRRRTCSRSCLALIARIRSPTGAGSASRPVSCGASARRRRP